MKPNNFNCRNCNKHYQQTNHASDTKQEKRIARSGGDGDDGDKIQSTTISDAIGNPTLHRKTQHFEEEKKELDHVDQDDDDDDEQCQLQTAPTVTAVTTTTTTTTTTTSNDQKNSLCIQYDPQWKSKLLITLIKQLQSNADPYNLFTKHVNPIEDDCPDYDIVKKEEAMSFQTLQILVQQRVLHDIDDIEIGLQREGSSDEKSYDDEELHDKGEEAEDKKDNEDHDYSFKINDNIDRRNDEEDHNDEDVMNIGDDHVKAIN